MSDNILGARAEILGERDPMKTALDQAEAWARQIEAAEFRGIGDTREAARGRASRRFNVPESYLTRLIYRAHTMRDVSGGIYLALQRAAEQLERSALRAEAHTEALNATISNLPEPVAPRPTWSVRRPRQESFMPELESDFTLFQPPK